MLIISSFLWHVRPKMLVISCHRGTWQAMTRENSFTCHRKWLTMNWLSCYWQVWQGFSLLSQKLPTLLPPKELILFRKDLIVFKKRLGVLSRMSRRFPVRILPLYLYLIIYKGEEQANYRQIWQQSLWKYLPGLFGKGNSEVNEADIICVEKRW